MRKLFRRIARLAIKALPDSDRLRDLAYRPKFETWLKSETANCRTFENRFKMYDYLIGEVLSEAKISYLEFGVFQGESIRHVVGLNSHSDSQFVGFDTFTGLPEDWVALGRTVDAKTFDTQGEPPRIGDDRVTFVKGLFQDTLPGFLETFEPGGQLIIHNDADLYSSTLFVLTRAQAIIRPGTILIFDEFRSIMHEFRALEDFCSAYSRDYEVVAATQNFAKVAIRVL